MSSSKPLESWLVFFNPAQLDSTIRFDLTNHISTLEHCYGLALDGGLRRAEQLNLSVHWHIGDFDSISTKVDSSKDTLGWEQLADLGKTDPNLKICQKYALEKTKDFIDGESVQQLLKARNLREVVFFDFWQGRWDFSLLHFMWLLQNNWLINKLTIILPEGYCKFASGSNSFKAPIGSSFSIFPIDIMEKVNISGSIFDGESFTFKPGTGHSFSNKFNCNKVDVDIQHNSRYLFFVFNEGELR